MNNPDKNNDETEVTAAVLLIGDELLSGRTRDINLQTIASFLAPIGIQIKICQIIGDDQKRIADAINQLRAAYDYLFTTGGIGPTHDDITADAVAQAFNVPIHIRDDARQLLEAHYGQELNDSRLRMARIPQGARLIHNPVSAAPGIHIENLFVLAGVPKIAAAMLGDIAQYLKGGTVIKQESLRLEGVVEGEIANQLRALQARFPEVNIGSYPYYHSPQNHGAEIMLRGRDEQQLKNCFVR